jgi:hypothetical protein
MAGEDPARHVGIARGVGFGGGTVGRVEDEHASSRISTFIEQRPAEADATFRVEGTPVFEVRRSRSCAPRGRGFRIETEEHEGRHCASVAESPTRGGLRRARHDPVGSEI